MELPQQLRSQSPTLGTREDIRAIIHCSGLRRNCLCFLCLFVTIIPSFPAHPMFWNTDSLLKTCGNHPANREVIAYLTTQHPSAHSDIADELLNAAAASVPDADRRWFCPDTRSYAYVALHLPDNGKGDGVVYALAIGMQTLIFRLPEKQLPPDAVKQRLLGLFQEISADGDWLTIEMFRNGQSIDANRALARSLTESAYRWAKSLAASPHSTSPKPVGRSGA